MIFSVCVRVCVCVYRLDLQHHVRHVQHLGILITFSVRGGAWLCVAARCCVLWCVAVRCSVLHCVAVYLGQIQAFRVC